MFALDDAEKVYIFTTERELIPQPGWTVIAMISAEPEENDSEKGGEKGTD